MRHPAARHRADNVETSCHERRLKRWRCFGLVGATGPKCATEVHLELMPEASPPASAATMVRWPTPAAPLDHAHALTRARPSGWTDIHPCFCNKFKPSPRGRAGGTSDMPDDQTNLPLPGHSCGVFAYESAVRHNRTVIRVTRREPSLIGDEISTRDCTHVPARNVCNVRFDGRSREVGCPARPPSDRGSPPSSCVCSPRPMMALGRLSWRLPTQGFAAEANPMIMNSCKTAGRPVLFADESAQAGGR